jgi:5,10-methylenetetrahydromethanopterin reductase
MKGTLMDIAVGLTIDGPLDATIELATHLRSLGFTKMWSSQIFGPDTLTVLAILGRELRDVDFGTAVVPIQPRHPAMLAAQARTVQEAIGGRLSLGIGLSHRITVEDLWGLSYDRPAAYMSEYLAALAPMLRGEKVEARGERVTSISPFTVGPKEVRSPDLLVAALGPKMLEMTGTMADGTLLWLTGVKTRASHVTPLITEAAAKARRPPPRIVCALPIAVTNDEKGTRERVNESLVVYGTLPSYRAMLDREGAAGPADVGLFGSKEKIFEQLDALATAGVTEFSANVSASRDDRDATLDALIAYAKQ